MFGWKQRLIDGNYPGGIRQSCRGTFLEDREMADTYLPHVVENVPAEWIFGQDGRPVPIVQGYIRQGVVRVIAGPRLCHVVTDWPNAAQRRIHNDQLDT